MNAESLQNKFKQLQWRQIAYPAISLVLVLIILLLFARTARFLSVQINKPFTVEGTITNADLLKVNLAGYETIARRLQLDAAPASSQPAADTAAPQLATPAPALPEKKEALKIAIYGSIDTNNAATELKDALTAIGFTVQKTGALNQRKTETSIAVKLAAKDNYPASLTALQQVVSAANPNTTSEILAASEPYDIVIVIGSPPATSLPEPAPESAAPDTNEAP